MRYTTPKKPIKSPKNAYEIPVERLTDFEIEYESSAEMVQSFGSEEAVIRFVSNQVNVERKVAARRELQDADKGLEGAALEKLLVDAVAAGKDWAFGVREKGKGSQKERAKKADAIFAIAASGKDEDRAKLAALVAAGDLEGLAAFLGSAK